MINKKIEYLLWALGTDNTQLAAYAGCSESNFSRLKSGSREPARDSVTIRKFARAICLSAADSRLTDTLKTIAGAKDIEDEMLSDAVIDWLFDTDSSTLPRTPWGIDAMQFGEKLSAVMTVAGLSNSKLSRLANIDPSYISRMRSGDRMPKNNPSLINRICAIIAAKAFEKGSEKEIFELTGQQGRDEKALTEALFGWLYDKRGSEGVLAVDRLIDSIASIQDGRHRRSEQLAMKIKTDKAEIYTGVVGLQTAVTRLLGTAAKEGNRKLFFYSDQPTGWLSGSFNSVWTELMRECLENNVKFTIIHNLDNKPLDIFEGITNWLPLYMTGGITPYYCPLSAGERQYTTIFIDEGHACIESSFVRGMEGSARYRYITAADELLYAKQNFDIVLKNCKPFLTIKRTDEFMITGDYSVYRTGSIQISLNKREAIIQKINSPQLSFCFEHPMIIKSLQRYFEKKRRL
ncbi:MAG: helix-turn-helix domain-containing protein [Ruminococcus sp.]|nr:helix-turn-helix domain-containing protein [Ruminococcus sp.]